jgi:hypothetical protein
MTSEGYRVVTLSMRHDDLDQALRRAKESPLTLSTIVTHLVEAYLSGTIPDACLNHPNTGGPQKRSSVNVPMDVWNSINLAEMEKIRLIHDLVRAYAHETLNVSLAVTHEKSA